MDVFTLRDRVVAEYRDYFASFVQILDERVRQYARELLDRGEMWPDPVLQLNPAYEPGPTLGELAARGDLTPETAAFFGPHLRLHRHQEEALALGRQGQSYLVSTGTGSGKSLTYLLPIFDYVLRHEPSRHSVRAILVYPMNALINSQLTALQRFREQNWPACPVRFDRYTGQESRERKNALINDPPHILLTNYAMLEYLLLRPQERTLLALATRELKFLVFDEIHFYRGRQGADVAMLIRRVRQRAARADLQCLGTSATLATEGDRETRRARIAQVGEQLFGVAFSPGQVIDETLRRVVQVPAPATPAELREAVSAEPPGASLEEVIRHPLAAWVEETFGLATEEGRLVRRAPITFQEGLGRLMAETGLPEEVCRSRLQAVLEAGNAARLPTGEPVFAFRLHQFLASGSSIYATLEEPRHRHLTTAGHYSVPAGEGAAGERVLFPLAFCRECGQEYYLASLVREGEAQRLVPRSPLLTGREEEEEGRPGYFALEVENLWEGKIEELPEHWLEERRHGLVLKRNYAPHQPQAFWAAPDGTLSLEEQKGRIPGWFVPRPFLLCLRCRAAYDLREKSDYRKLATLSQVGRSTATTILSLAVLKAMGQDPAVEPAARKILSFTDNRQDASLQAGHLNDFVQVVLFRGALVRALEQGPLTLDRLGPALFEALELSPRDFMREPVASGPGYEEARRVMEDLLEYLALEDLARTWRVVQPNLEQCGLLRISYRGLEELAWQDDLWSGAPAMEEADGQRRYEVLKAVLDHLRSRLVIKAGILEETALRSLIRRAHVDFIKAPWGLERNAPLRRGMVALLPGVAAARGEGVGLGFRSAVGRYLRSRHTWGRAADLTAREVEDLVHHLVKVLRGHILTGVQYRGQEVGVQIRAGALLWERGEGKAPGPDPVRAKALYLRRPEWLARTPNHYFQTLYKQEARQLAGIAAGEHTGQVKAERRLEREKEFQAGSLPAIFCSPTMELGVDIADLLTVHLRNLPPSPANYAQRSGRAGRGGRPALVLAFCLYGNAHDHYFFRQKERLIAGAVDPPRFDLGNPELLAAHLHSVWLAFLGLDLRNSMADLLDLESPGCPLLPEVAAALQLSEARKKELHRIFRQIASLAGPAVTGADWFGGSWLEEILAHAPLKFDRAFDRWRELYRAALEQRDNARRVIDRPRMAREEREAARQSETEAQRELELLLNQGEQTESDFYPYRYLAAEGFLPGYNFPRLPLRALVWTGEETESIDRPRFLGLAEFGPHNIIYHEGRKHRVTGCRLPAGGLEARILRAKVCLSCGFLHPREESRAELCRHCGVRLDALTAQFPQRLLEQPTVKTSRWVRITSEEEERAREGYHLTTHFWYPDLRRPKSAQLLSPEGEPLLEVTYIPGAELWRLNHGWRRAADRQGFSLAVHTGEWLRGEDHPGDGGGRDASQGPLLTGVKPFVTDQRNLLFLRPLTAAAPDAVFLKTLAYALQRGLQVLYQVEEQEIAVELLGQGDWQRILLYEAAEGGTGIWERLLADREGFAGLAREALRICHFQPETGEEIPAEAAACGRGCYDCLLSYANQTDHRFIHRRLIRDFLWKLSQAKFPDTLLHRTYEEQYEWLRQRLDPASSLEREFLDFLYSHRLRLPDFAQYLPHPDVPVQVDFYYHRDNLPGVCIFLDGPSHDDPRQSRQDLQVREALQDRGFKVITIRHDRPMAEQVLPHRNLLAKSS